MLSNKFGKRPADGDTDAGASPGRRSRRSRHHSGRSDKYQTMSSDDEDKEVAAGGRSTVSEPVVGGGGVGQTNDRDRQYEGDEDDTYSVSEKRLILDIFKCLLVLGVDCLVFSGIIISTLIN